MSADSIDSAIPTRASLIERLKNAGDHESWRDFFETYWHLIYRTAKRAGLTEAEAQDAVQETILSVFKNIPQFAYNKANGSFKGWLLKITWWRINDQFKHRRSHEISLSEEDAAAEVAELPAPPDSLDRFWQEEWERNLFSAAVQKVKEKMDPRVFQIFDLHVLQKVPVNAVAARLKVSPPRVYLIKHRVGARIKRALAEINEGPSV